MSKPRVDLQHLLEDIAGKKHVYFQPPDNLNLNYPAIVYGLLTTNNSHADNSVYAQKNAYQITVIDHDPDSEISKRVSKLPTCRMIRAFSSDRLNHFVYALNY